MSLWNGNLTDNRIVDYGAGLFLEKGSASFFVHRRGSGTEIYGFGKGSYGMCTIFSEKICEMFRIYK